MAALPFVKVGAAVVSSIFGGKKVHDEAKAARRQSAAAADMAKKNTPPPLPDEAELLRASRRKAAMRFGALGSGRASTILSNEGKLGSP